MLTLLNSISSVIDYWWLMLFLEHVLRATHLVLACNQVLAGTVLATSGLTPLKKKNNTCIHANLGGKRVSECFTMSLCCVKSLRAYINYTGWISTPVEPNCFLRSPCRWKITPSCTVSAPSMATGSTLPSIWTAAVQARLSTRLSLQHGEGGHAATLFTSSGMVIYFQSPQFNSYVSHCFMYSPMVKLSMSTRIIWKEFYFRNLIYLVGN